ncbi:MAG: dehypoxanthine futalosine cyclase, partial [Bacteroidetes bacterium SW_11_45_7]
MNTDQLLQRAMNLGFLSREEGVYLYENAPTSALMYAANEVRKIKKGADSKVTWIIDRNMNTTNVCIANCKFCNFFRKPGSEESYITTKEEYRHKIEETMRYGGRQLLLQGGHHPELGLDYYVQTFSMIKDMFPEIKL